MNNVADVTNLGNLPKLAHTVPTNLAAAVINQVTLHAIGGLFCKELLQATKGSNFSKKNVKPSVSQLFILFSWKALSLLKDKT